MSTSDLEAREIKCQNIQSREGVFRSLETSYSARFTCPVSMTGGVTCNDLFVDSINGISSARVNCLSGARENIQTQIDKLNRNFNTSGVVSVNTGTVNASQGNFVQFINTRRLNACNIRCQSAVLDNVYVDRGFTKLSNCSNAFFTNASIARADIERLNISHGSASFMKSRNIETRSLDVYDRTRMYGRTQITDLLVTSCSANVLNVTDMVSKNAEIKNLKGCISIDAGDISCTSINGVSFDQFAYLMNINADVQSSIDSVIDLIVRLRPSMDDFSCYSGTFRNLESAFCVIDASLAADTIETDYASVNVSLTAANLDVTGQAVFAQTILNGYSDIRLKEITNELDHEKCLENLFSLRCFEYLPNSEAIDQLRLKESERTRTQYGLSAQEVMENFPCLVRENGCTGYLTIQYDRFVPVIVSALKALDARIASNSCKCHSRSVTRDDTWKLSEDSTTSTSHES